MEAVERFRAFLAKLTERAESLREEVRAEAQNVYNENPDTFRFFVGNVRAQFEGIIHKAEAVFDEKIAPLEYVSPDEFSVLASEFWVWRERVAWFASVAEASAEETPLEQQYKEWLEEFERIKQSFFCTQCHAPLEIPEMYFVSTYISCQFCGTKNMFHPSNRMREMPDIKKAIMRDYNERFQKYYNKIRRILDERFD